MVDIKSTEFFRTKGNIVFCTLTLKDGSVVMSDGIGATFNTSVCEQQAKENAINKAKVLIK